MSAAVVAVVPSWPKALGVALVIAALGALPAPAFGAPEWGITMTHANAYGLQASQCPTGKEEDFPGEPERDCGVDPYTGSGTTFAQESGFNTYTIKVKNVAKPGAPQPGTALSCAAGEWSQEPTFAYRWLRNGATIPGAEGPEYTLVQADEGTPIECEVIGANIGGATARTSAPVQAAPVSATAPTNTSLPTVGEETGATVAIGSELSCSSGEWGGEPTFTYQWLRNGAPIPGATGPSYVATSEDAGESAQCQVTASNSAGSVVAISRFPTPVEPEPAPFPPYSFGEPTIPSSVEVNTPVTVADKMPEGLRLVGYSGHPAAFGTGWDCQVASRAAGVTCVTDAPLAARATYPPITLRVRVEPPARVGTPSAGGVVNVATAAGGGAISSSVGDQTTIAAAVPFGVQSFATSVAGVLGGPFTQSAGHPVSATAEFVLNYTPDNNGEIETAGGVARATEAELPPGFVGNPQSAAVCTAAQALPAPIFDGHLHPTNECPASSVVGFATVGLSGNILDGKAQPYGSATSLVYNLEPTPGTAAAFGFTVEHVFYALTAKLRSDENYGVTIGDDANGRIAAGVLAVHLTLCGFGVTGQASEQGASPSTVACAPSSGASTPFLTMPSRCTGAPPTTTLVADTYQDPSDDARRTVYNGFNLVGDAPTLSESFVTGCNDLQFQPEVELKPSAFAAGGTAQADEPTGASFSLKVPQTNEAGANATPELKDATVTLPEGMTVDPSAANGLQACSNMQFGLGSTAEPVEPAACPLASQIGTVKIVTPLLEKPLEGQVFLGEPECSPCSNTDAEAGRIFRLFLQVRSVERGVIVKLAGHVTANPTTGRLQATFTEQPQLPFSELLLTFNGGARASLANPQTCGTFTTTTDLTPWSAPGLGGLSGTEPIPGTPDATPSSSFNVDLNGAGGACPATMPFSPSFSAGSQTPTAGASSPFAVTIGREDREQNLAGITVSTPPGLLGKIAGIPQCLEAQANAGTCGPESQIGTTTVAAGPGPHPFYLGGRVYLTGPYKGDPFGLSIVVPAVAGPFNLGNVVVRAAIAVNPSTAALTITSDPLPQFVDGVQLRLRQIHVEVDRANFMLNPTNCAAQGVGAMITAARGASSTVSSPYEVGACQNLPFAPSLSASTQAKTSKANGASLTVTVRSTTGQANIAKVDLQLSKALPSRLTTLQKACAEAPFNTNPAGCPAASDIGTARAITPILNVPLTGPAYLVSHGGVAFPDLEFLLQGENGVEIVLDGKTDIKDGVTYSRFETVPDAPISSFVTILPEGPHSILAAPSGDLCGKRLAMGTTITAQNGKQIVQRTKIAVTGCIAMKTKPLTRAQKLKRALHVCRTKYKTKSKKAKRLACEQQAGKRYGPIKRAKKTNRRGTR